VPVFLEQAGGLNPLTTGLVMFPISVANVIMSPVAASLVTRRGTGAALVVSGSGMTGPPQTAFYQAVPADRAGTAGGQLNTVRYVGASGAAALLALVFAQQASVDGLRIAAVAMAGIAGALTVQGVTGRHGRGWGGATA
jgi:hypothetical protein